MQNARTPHPHIHTLFRPYVQTMATGDRQNQFRPIGLAPVLLAAAMSERLILIEQRIGYCLSAHRVPCWPDCPKCMLMNFSYPSLTLLYFSHRHHSPCSALFWPGANRADPSFSPLKATDQSMHYSRWSQVFIFLLCYQL